MIFSPFQLVNNQPQQMLAQRSLPPINQVLANLVALAQMKANLLSLGNLQAGSCLPMIPIQQVAKP